jgi:hypothetical protein
MRRDLFRCTDQSNPDPYPKLKVKVLREGVHGTYGRLRVLWNDGERETQIGELNNFAIYAETLARVGYVPSELWSRFPLGNYASFTRGMALNVAFFFRSRSSMSANSRVWFQLEKVLFNQSDVDGGDHLVVPYDWMILSIFLITNL